MTTPAVQTITSADRSITFKIDTRAVRFVFAGLPKIAYFWTRDFFGRSFGQHRVRWLRSKSTQFGRGTETSKGIKVTQINEGGATGGALKPNEVRYRVFPDAKRMETTQAASAALEQLFAEVATGNEILPVHEFGMDIRSGGFQFVPVKTRPGDFRKWRAEHPGAQLLFLRSKTDPTKQIVYEVVRRRGRPGRPRKGEAPPTARLRMRFLLTKLVRMRPTLRLYETWDALLPTRDALWRETADKMMRDADKRDPRDI